MVGYTIKCHQELCVVCVNLYNCVCTCIYIDIVSTYYSFLIIYNLSMYPFANLSPIVSCLMMMMMVVILIYNII